MKKVEQTISHKGRGDCVRAVIASLFELEIEQVPHFILFKGDYYATMFYYFFWAMGYEYMWYHRTASLGKKKYLDEADSINGFFYGVVPSKNFKDVTHAVVINVKGLVVHDPSPNKQYQYVNVIQTGELRGWYCFKDRGANLTGDEG